jgi:hypothetical protein
MTPGCVVVVVGGGGGGAGAGAGAGAGVGLGVTIVGGAVATTVTPIADPPVPATAGEAPV